MGRLVNCQEVCSHMKDFKESAGMMFRNAMWRGYPRRMVQSVWSRFLFQRWHSVDIRVKELRVWFSKVWGFLAKHGARNVPNPLKPALQLKDLEGSLLVLGCPQRLTSSSGFDAASSISVMECDFPEARILTNISHLNLNLTSSTVGSSFSVTSTSSSSSSTDGSDNNAVSRSSVSSRSAVRDRGGSGVNSGSISGGDVEKSFAAADSGIAVNSSLSSSTSTVIVTVEKVVENTVTVTVPVETTVERTVLVPVETTVERTVPVSVETTIERTVPVSVETTVERFVQVPVEKTVERLIQQLVSVDRTVPVSVPVTVEVSVPVPVEHLVSIESTVERTVEVTQVVEVPVETCIDMQVRKRKVRRVEPEDTQTNLPLLTSNANLELQALCYDVSASVSPLRGTSPTLLVSANVDAELGGVYFDDEIPENIPISPKGQQQRPHSNSPSSSTSASSPRSVGAFKETRKGKQLLITDFCGSASTTTSNKHGELELKSLIPHISTSSTNTLVTSGSQSSQPKSQGTRGVPKKSDWNPTLLAQHEEYRSATIEERRFEIWSKWSRQEKYYVYGVSGAFFREEQRRWKQREDDASRKKDLTIDGDIHPNPGPCFSSQWNSNTSGRWRPKRREPWLKFAGARPVAADSRAIPGNRQTFQVMTNHSNCWRGPHGPYHRQNSNQKFFFVSIFPWCK